MADCVLDVKIGVDGTESKELYRSIDVMVEMHQEKLVKINQELCGILGKTTTPFITIEYPQTNLQNIEIFNFKGKDYDTGYQHHNGKLYQYANPRNKDTIKLIKNVEKQFQKLSKLNNIANLKLSLYSPLEQNKLQQPLLLLNRSKIKGHLQTDQQLNTSFIEIIRRISNQFLNSPIMAFLELLEQFAMKVELEAVEHFPNELKDTFRKMLSFGQWVHKQNTGELIKCKGDMVMHITLPKLLCIKVSGDAAVFGVIFQLFS